MKIFIYLFGILVLSKVFPSEAIEKWQPSKAKVGDLVTFEIELKNIQTNSVEYPKIGFYPEKEVPNFEILSVVESKNIFQFQVRFLEAGEFSFPIQWKNENGKLETAKEKIQIESNLTGSEFDIYDISEPIEFSGPFLLRLLGWTVGILLVLGMIAYFILKVKRTPKLTPNAKFKTIEPESEKLKFRENQLIKLLEQEEISHKEFVYLLSLEIKILLHEKYKVDSESLTNKELMELIQSKTQISDLERIRMENYLDRIKYMPNEEKISREFAKTIYKNWMAMLKK
ncbi:MAG: hypothetical protein N3A69_03255 [Leptospiraceae bacterium]|nr:hypothetical protein [Leptospiraceae bacterium]